MLKVNIQWNIFSYLIARSVQSLCNFQYLFMFVHSCFYKYERVNRIAPKVHFFFYVTVVGDYRNFDSHLKYLFVGENSTSSVCKGV